MTDTDLGRWIGRNTQTQDTINPAIVAQLAATLDLPDIMAAPSGRSLPPCWHWAFFNPLAVQSGLGPDGHPERGDFLPPVTLPRRMWAGSRLVWHGDFEVGSRVDKRSTILNVQSKSGRGGEMVFVTVGHAYEIDGQPILSEEHDIVYREDAGDAEREALARLAQRIHAGEHEFERSGARQRQVDAGPVMLFRYSAVTFNGHRIHYDRSYCEHIEHYPGLIVHGPLIATLLITWAGMTLYPQRRIREFAFRAQRPTFDLAPLHLHADEPGADGSTLALWSTNNVGEIALSAQIRFD